MIIEDTVTHATITLPDRLTWANEFDYSPLVSVHSYALDGALLIEQGVKQAGRPIQFDSADDLNWVARADVLTLQAWAAIPDRKFRLELEYPGDTRVFFVVFDTTDEKSAITASPVSELPAQSNFDFYHLKSLRFVEVEE